MKLRTQFIVTMLLFGAVLVIMAASAMITNQQIESAMEQEKRAVDIADGASEISYLVNNYLIYREDLQLKRWQKRFAAFTDEVASLHIDRPEQQALIANMQANQIRLKEVLDSVGSLSPNRDAALDEASLQVSWSRMAVQTQGLVSDASRLSQQLHRQTDELIYKRTMLIYVMVGLFGVFLLVSYMQTYRRILRSIVKLRDSAAVIGSGNLDFVIEETKDDEIGDLSHAFNQMTADLKAVTASKTDLEREIAERKRIQAEIQRLAKQRQLALDAARMGWWHYDPITRISSWDERYKEIFGVTGCQSPNDEILARLHPEDLPGVWAKVEAALDPVNPQLYVAEYRINLPDGPMKWIEAHGVASFEGDGENRRATSFVGTVADITERKRAEEALRKSEEKYLKTFQSNPACVGLSRLSDGLVIEANDVMLMMLGYNNNEFIGHTIVELGVWNDLADREHMLRTLMTEGRSINQEYWLRTKTGELLLCNHWAELIQIGDEPHVIFAFFDITERKRLEEELKKSEEESRLLIKYAPSMIYELDFSGPRFITVNDAMCSMLGYTREELLSKNPLDLLEAESRKTFQDRIRKQLAGEKLSDLIEYAGRAKDGRIVYCLLNISFTYKDGKPLGAVVIAHDITERKKAEQALAERTAKLEEINRELESFSYSISHDLRAPLRAIDGYTRSILKKTGDKFDEETTRKFNDIRSNAQMMGKLIDDILTLSRLGRAKMSMVNLAMEGIINDVWKELQIINPGRAMTLIVQSMPLGYGDLTLIKQVYTNLLSNAVKFTKYKNPAQIEAGSYIDGDDHIYYVKDNGIGFDMAYYDKLFGIFQRLHNDPDFEGTGVGLATIQRVIHMHGGRVWAEGKVNQGATFYFTLPI